MALEKFQALESVKNYYQTPESRCGYSYLLGGIQHFGYYPPGKENIFEKQAQIEMQELLARKAQLTAYDRVLDAGCGQGRVAVYLAKEYDCEVMGITIVPREVRK
ncbi:class I SAM-dependent methyltransferase [Patescibacteria group bacterium]|nr:class I SAM-dependent methyltransferase [Patescibacteria group bacterium]